jgi:hypothetical protein
MRASQQTTEELTEPKAMHQHPLLVGGRFSKNLAKSAHVGDPSSRTENRAINRFSIGLDIRGLEIRLTYAQYAAANNRFSVRGLVCIRLSPGLAEGSSISKISASGYVWISVKLQGSNSKDLGIQE